VSYSPGLLKVDPDRLFKALTDVQKAEWRDGRASLDEICPRVKRETSAVRNELIRRLRNWSVAPTLQVTP
jgi:hypothetical protein